MKILVSIAGAVCVVAALAMLGIVGAEVVRLRAERIAARPVLMVVEPVPLWGIPSCHRRAAEVNAYIARCWGAMQGCQDAARFPEDCQVKVARLGCDWDQGREQLIKDCPHITGYGVYR